jgi:hypothetical protein
MFFFDVIYVLVFFSIHFRQNLLHILCFSICHLQLKFVFHELYLCNVGSSLQLLFEHPRQR